MKIDATELLKALPGKKDEAVREVLERVMPKSELPRSQRIQQWIGRSPVASAIVYVLLFAFCATIMLLVFGGINYFLTGKPIF